MIALDGRAYQSDETLGYDRWCASQLTCGKGTHEALIIVFKDATEKSQFIVDHQLSVSSEWSVQP